MKMSDVFNLPLSHQYRDLESQDGAIIVHACEIGEDEAEAIALAVNNHDKLVEALESIVEWRTDIGFSATGNPADFIEHYKGEAEAALQAIKGDQ